MNCPCAASTIECEDNEVYGCTTSESRCEESCMAFRAANDACRGDELPCTPACECKDGFKRNAQGKCVPQDQCECYPPGSNSSIPIGHVVHVDECYEWWVKTVFSEVFPFTLLSVCLIKTQKDRFKEAVVSIRQCKIWAYCQGKQIIH